MLTRLVRVALAAEIAIATGLLAALYRGLGLSLGASALAVAGVVLAVRVFLVGFSFLASWISRTPRAPEHRIGAAATLAMMGGELQALLVGYYIRLPFPRGALRPDPPPGSGTRVPVMLAHGYLANRGYFAPTVRWLEQRGVESIHVPDFPSVFSTIEHYADKLHREIERVASASPHGRIVLVCHSMGGLAARCYLQRHGASRIARLVTLGSPHHGTALAPFGFGPHARQMRRGSPFLTALAEAEGRQPPPIPAVSIYATHDNMVSPQAGSRLAWAENVPFPGVGHIRMVAHPPVLERVLAELREAGAVAASD